MIVDDVLVEPEKESSPTEIGVGRDVLCLEPDETCSTSQMLFSSVKTERKGTHTDRQRRSVPMIGDRKMYDAIAEVS